MSDRAVPRRDLAELLDSIRTGNGVVDAAMSLQLPDTTCLGASGALGRLLGRPASDLKGHSLADILVDVAPDVPERFQRELRERGAAQECVHTFVPGRGFRWLELTGTRALIAGRRLYQITWVDVTDELCRGARAFDEQQETTALLHDLLDDAADHDGVLRAATRALMRFGRAGAAAVAELDEARRRIHVSMLATASGADRGATYDVRTTIFAPLLGAEPGRTLSDLGRHAPSCPFLADHGFQSARATTLAGPFQRPRGLVVVFDAATPVPAIVLRLVAAWLDADQARRAQNGRAALDHLMNEVRDLTGGATLNLNNQLACIVANADRLLGLDAQNGDAAAHIENIQVAAGSAATVASSLQALARTPDPSPTLCDVNRLVEDTARLVDQSYKHVDVQLELTQPIPWVMASEGEIEQALVNVFQNAVDAMRRTGTLTVSTRLRSADDRRVVDIDISDTGPGIPKRHLPHIFEPYYSGRRGHGGSLGLGLTIVDEVVKKHHGLVAVESAGGAGTTVTITLPLARRGAGRVRRRRDAI